MVPTISAFMRLAALTILLLPVLNQDLSAQGHWAEDRWNETATDGGGLGRGDSTNLTWGFVPDGTGLPSGVGEPATNSDLISFLDSNIGAGGGGNDLTNRPWFDLFEDSYDRWGEISGLDFTYEANDDGAAITGFSSSPKGELGVRADMRIGGHSIDGQTGSNTLAYNYFPDHGDMVIDTDNSNFYSDSSNNYRGLRNVVMHEVGHGLGISHLISDDSQFLMEPFINTSFDGPQFSDILGTQRQYGDNYEDGVGNDLLGLSSDLGDVTSASSILIGEDASDKVVAASDIDFVSIDGTDDTDYFQFNVLSEGRVDLELTAMGPTYHIERQNGNDSHTFDAKIQNDLVLTLFDTDGTTIIFESDVSGLGGIEMISQILASGTYYARISGDNSATEAQFYQLSVQFSAVPEPAGLTALAAIGGAVGFYRRRRNRFGQRSPS